jgi:hypothetical protein
MAEKVRLVAESLQEWEKIGTTPEAINEAEQLNEGAKGLLRRFLKNPEKKSRFISAYAKQINKVKGLKNAVEKLDTAKMVEYAKQSLNIMEKDPKRGYPWFKIKDGQIIGGGALGVEKGNNPAEGQ